MKMPLLLVVCTFSLFCGGCGSGGHDPAGENQLTPQDSPEAADLKLLQGKWQVVAHIYQGKPSKVGNGNNTIWNIKGNKIFYRPGREDTFRLNATITPKTLDVDSLENGEWVKDVPAIYALDGDTFILCVGITKRAHPTAFETQDKLGQRILVLRRVKMMKQEE